MRNPFCVFQNNGSTSVGQKERTASGAHRTFVSSCSSRKCYLAVAFFTFGSVLGLAVMELSFFIAVPMVLRFGFGAKTLNSTLMFCLLLNCACTALCSPPPRPHFIKWPGDEQS